MSRSKRFYVVRTPVARTETEPLEGARLIWKQDTYVYSIWASDSDVDIDPDRIESTHAWFLTAVAEVLSHIR